MINQDLWATNSKGDWVRDGYIISMLPDGSKCITTPDGVVLEKTFKYFYTAIKHVNTLLDS